MSDFVFRTPSNLSQLSTCLRDAGPETWLLGGGTDLVIRLRDRGIARGTLIDLTGVAGLDRIEVEDGWVSIGANVTYARLAGDPVIRARLSCLAQMASQVGSAQIRNMARLPGNIANASPGGDAVATLVALGAQVQVLDRRGETTLRPVAQVVTGIGRTSLVPGEAIIRVRIPLPGPSWRSAYGKIGMGARAQVVIANLSLTVLVDYDSARRRIQDAVVVLGSAAPVAFRAEAAELLLKGRTPGPELARELAAVLRDRVQASIGSVPVFQHKLNDVQGLALDLTAQLFPGEC